MCTSARTILAFTFLLVAIVLHMTLCEWGLEWPGPGPTEQMITMEWRNEMIGLFTDNHVRPEAGFIFGLAAPLLLIGLSIALFVENRARKGIGSCARCGYNLAGITRNNCPECGFKITTATTA